MTEESFVDFKCPYCGDAVSFPQDSVALVQECPLCSESLLLPAPGSEVGQRIPLPIKGQRLALRRLQAGDWRDLLECLSDEELFQYTEGRTLGEEEVLHWLESDAHIRLTTPGQPFCLGIELLDAAKLIGYLSLTFADPQRLQATLNVFVNRSHQQKGFATEAVDAALDFCFEGIGLHRIAAFCDSRNAAARRLCEKVGLRREGEFLKDRCVNGEWTNTLWYAVLREEYGSGASGLAQSGPA